jgi:hypothetical protein
MTLDTEKPAKKEHGMLEQQAGVQAESAAEPRKLCNAGLYVDGDTSNSIQTSTAVDINPRDTCHRKAGRKGPRDA